MCNIYKLWQLTNLIFLVSFMGKWMFSKWNNHQELVYIIWLTNTSVQLLTYCERIPGEKHNWRDYFVCWSSSSILTTTVYVQQGMFYVMISACKMLGFVPDGFWKHSPDRPLNLNSTDWDFFDACSGELCWVIIVVGICRLESYLGQ